MSGETYVIFWTPGLLTEVHAELGRLPIPPDDAIAFGASRGRGRRGVSTRFLYRNGMWITWLIHQEPLFN